VAGPSRLPPASDFTGLFHEMQRPSVGRLRQKKERFARASRGRGDRVSVARRIWRHYRQFEYTS
jgi:hypothetical protein